MANGFCMGKLRIPVLLLLFATAAVMEATRLSSLSTLSTSDIWMHLASGLWILKNHAVPRSGIFSQASASAWVDTSWWFDVKAALLYRMIGLRAIPVIAMSLKTLLAIVTFLLGGGLRGRFWPAAALSAVVQYVLGGVQPGPTYVSLFFFAVELILLFESRSTGKDRLLYWLPALFLVWANFDDQFVYGIGCLVLFLGRLAWEGRARAGTSSLLKTAGTCAALSVITSFVTPYFWRPYGVFFARFTSAAAQHMPDYEAMRFHQPQDYVLLLLAMAAFFSLGLRRSRDVFQIALLAGCAVLAFHSQRDTWLVALAAVAVVGQQIASVKSLPTKDTENTEECTGFKTIAGCAAIAIAVVVVAAFTLIPNNGEALLARIGQAYPVKAGDYIREHQLPQPLFNAFEWGGFLAWYLPGYPVAIDGRTGPYDDEFVNQYAKAMNAEIPYTQFSAMASAQTLLLQKKSVMGQALANVPAFRVAYSDDVAIVLTRQP
ncbi:MAG TPA: hypothetical protein VF753_06085 [Terriglobales bacterium]